MTDSTIKWAGSATGRLTTNKKGANMKEVEKERKPSTALSVEQTAARARQLLHNEIVKMNPRRLFLIQQKSAKNRKTIT